MNGSVAPTTKVAAGGAVGLITALIMWAISASGVDVPEAVLASVPWLAGLLASYLTPDRLVELGREVRGEAGRYRGKHEARTPGTVTTAVEDPPSETLPTPDPSSASPDTSAPEDSPGGAPAP